MISVAAFSDPMFEFIEEAISRGDNVLVHCLAGAHRAGTTGCACLMHFGGLEADKAIMVAKRLRPIIDPIGQLPQFLKRLEIMQQERGSK
jgi:protein-tyrosine phosphatase